MLKRTFLNTHLSLLRMHSFPVAMPCSRSWQCWRSAEPLTLNRRRSEPSSNIPAPDANAYSTSLRYDSSGNLYAWDGVSVWEQSGRRQLSTTSAR